MQNRSTKGIDRVAIFVHVTHNLMSFSMKKTLTLLTVHAVCLLLCLSVAGQERVTIKVTDKQLAKIPTGPYEATWESVEQNYQTPEWFMDAKFGIFIHWGLYSVPASGSEWYPRHMYNGLSREHRQKWGRQNEFGYKDFLPLFKAEKFNAEEWAALFREAGARYVIPTAEHHDGFAMYNSRLTKWNAKRMGPKRDVIGELAEAVRAEGLKFGVSNHRIENWDFMYPQNMPKDSTDLFLPQYATFYGPPQKPTDQSAMGPSAQPNVDPGATEAIINALAVEGRHPQNDAFLNEWEMRTREIIDRYKPDLLYFDNGINYRSLDPWKLRIAQYYYNSASRWGKDVSIQSKGRAYLAGSITDFERMGRAPKETLDHYWQVDEPIGNKFGYIEGLQIQSAAGVIRSLVNNISKNGNLCLNISPRGDGSIPDNQQEVLRTVGRWLKTYGEGVYGTRAYNTSDERNVRFTCRGDSIIYAFALQWDGKPFKLMTLNGLNIDNVTCLADGRSVAFQHTAEGLLIDASMDNVTDPAVCFRITLRKEDAFSYWPELRKPWGDMGDNTYINPVLPADFSDTDCIRVGDDFYAISSTMQFSPGMAIVHSRDLVNWEFTGHVVSDLTWLSPEMNWDRMNRYGHGIWAGSIRYHDGLFYVVFGTPDEGYFLSTAARCEDEWSKPVCLLQESGWDDCCLEWSDDGTPWFVGTCFKDDYKTWLMPMSGDATSLRRDEAVLVNESRRREASKLLHHDGWYYLIFSEFNGSEGRYVMARRSRSLSGPYSEEKRLTRNVSGDDEPNQGGIIEGPDGNWYFLTHHGRGTWAGRQVSLLPVVWEDGWPQIGQQGEDGLGTMVWQGPMPSPSMRPASSIGQFEEDFSSSSLNPNIEWNYQPRASMFTVDERKGWMRMKAFRPLKAGDMKTVGNIMTWRLWARCTTVSTTLVDASGIVRGVHCGMCFFAKNTSVAEVIREADGYSLLVRAGGDVYATIPLPSPIVYLRAICSPEGTGRFAYSLDGRQFITLDFSAQQEWASYRGARVGIFCYNDTEETGYADFDFVRVSLLKSIPDKMQ